MLRKRGVRATEITYYHPAQSGDELGKDNFLPFLAFTRIFRVTQMHAHEHTHTQGTGDGHTDGARRCN